MTTSETILLISSSGAIVAAFINAVSVYLNNKYSIKWKESSDSNISKLQSEFTRSNNTLNSLLTLYGSHSQQAQTRRIQAIESLWTNLLKFREIIPSIGHVLYNILTEEEVKNYVEHLRKRQAIEENTLIRINETENFNKCLAYGDNIDLERPFLSDKAWFYFELYKGFVSRLSYFLIEQAKKEAFKHWHNDQALKNIMEKSLTKDEFHYFYSHKVNSLKIALSFLENKILQETNKTLLGETFSQNALEISIKYESLIKLEEGKDGR
jgi:hypothetical protein